MANSQVHAAAVWDGSVGTGFHSGTGESDDPYIIATGAELAYLASQVNPSSGGNSYSGKYFKLTDDIDLNNNAWTPIGSAAILNRFFAGIFDGNGKTISGVNVNTTKQFNGLFGVVSGTIKNLNVSGTITSNSTNSNHTGGIVGYLTSINGTVVNCSSACTVQENGSGTGSAGGVVGTILVSGGKVKNCYSVGGGVSGNNAGAIVGDNSVGGTVQNCFWLSTSFTSGIGTGTGSTYSFADSAGELSSPVTVGEIECDTLLSALNVWSCANNSSPAYLFWKTINGVNNNYPINTTDAPVFGISYNLDGGINNESNLASYQYGVGCGLQSPSKDSYIFDGWYNNAGLTGSSVTSVSITDYGDKTFYAKWTLDTSVQDNASIATAKGLLSGSFTAVEGTHTNFLTYLNALTGMTDTGVTLTLVSDNANVANNGAITYTGSEVTGNVVVHINKGMGTEDTKTISVTVPAHTPTAAELANAAIATAKGLLSGSFTAVEGTHTNFVTGKLKWTVFGKQFSLPDIQITAA